MKKQADNSEVVNEVLEQYNFPEYNITVEAKDVPDAQEKLKEILAANSQ